MDMHAGMFKKYEYLINQLISDSIGKVVIFAQDYIHIRAKEQTIEINFFITESRNALEIIWVWQISVQKTLKHKWSFLHDYPQDKMIKEIVKYMERKNKTNV